MTIDEKLKQTNITRILVVDDTPENLVAAKNYFENLDVKVDYATNGVSAIEKITQSYEEKDVYSLLLSDLQMEERNSGLDVVREGSKYLIPSFIVTGRNYDQPHNHHGPSTQIEPYLGSIAGKKEDENIWMQVLEKVVDNISEGEGTPFYKALSRYRSYIGGMSENIADLSMTRFNHLKR
jgi:CheY-like chemotaxis protein